MQLGMIGLGRMGANMVRRLISGGHDCVVFDMSPQVVADLAKEKTVGAASLEDFAAKLIKSRAVWLMVLAAVVDRTVADLVPHVKKSLAAGTFQCALRKVDHVVCVMAKTIRGLIPPMRSLRDVLNSDLGHERSVVRKRIIAIGETETVSLIDVPRARERAFLCAEDVINFRLSPISPVETGPLDRLRSVPTILQNLVEARSSLCATRRQRYIQVANDDGWIVPNTGPQSLCGIVQTVRAAGARLRSRILRS